MDLAWLMPTLAALGGVLLVTFLFFFATTRGALIVRSWMPGVKAPDAHVYPIYSRMGLIRLIDFQPIIAAILLFQYDRLVRIMKDAFNSIWNVAQDKKVSLRTATFIVACTRILHARELRGLYP